MKKKMTHNLVCAGRALMVALGYSLKKLAHEHNIAVLVLMKFWGIGCHCASKLKPFFNLFLKVTNHTVGAGENGKTKPALGETWKSIPHVRLMLSRDNRNNSCTISILKHTSMVTQLTKQTLCFFFLKHFFLLKHNPSKCSVSQASSG